MKNDIYKNELKVINRWIDFYKKKLVEAFGNKSLKCSNFGMYLEGIEKYEKIAATLATMKRAFEKSQAVISNPKCEYYQLCDEIMKVLNEIGYNINVDSQSGKLEFYKVQDA